jgi:hypothetical protein
MSPEGGEGFGDGEEPEEWEARPVVFPTFQVPGRVATPVCWGLLGAAVLAIVAGLVTAISFDFPATQGLLGGSGSVNDFEPGIGTADRVILFARGAGSVTVALVVLVAVVVAAMGNTVKRRSDLLRATVAVATMVVLSNLAEAVAVLGTTTDSINSDLFTNFTSNASTILELLPATLSAVAALVYAVTCLRNPGTGQPRPE